MVDHSWDDGAVHTVHFSTSDAVDAILDLQESVLYNYWPVLNCVLGLNYMQ